MHSTASPTMGIPDRLTVLSHAHKNMAKTWCANGEMRNYDSAKYFALKEWPVRNIRELSALLCSLEPNPNSCIIRGRFVGEEKAKTADPECGARKVRRLLDMFEDQPLHTMLVDIDNFTPIYANPILEPEAAIREFLEAHLPPAFRHASFHWQLSNSAGHPSKTGLLKAHVWFWLENSATSRQLKAWALSTKAEVDVALFNPVQVHYTAAPVFEDGVANPVPLRSGFVDGPCGRLGGAASRGCPGVGDATQGPQHRHRAQR